MAPDYFVDYKGYAIKIQVFRDGIRSNFVGIYEVFAMQQLAVRQICKEGFATASDAKIAVLESAKHWINEQHLPSSAC